MKRQSQRLFLALWPDAKVRAQLAELAEQVTEHPVSTANLHLTLVFLGASSQQQSACIADAAAKISADPLKLQLDYLGGFPKPRIQWLGCRHIPPALLDLAENLRAQLPACGYPPETRRYVPHVTLARKVKQPRYQVIEAPIYWQVKDFVLAESCSEKAGVRYRVIEKWGLG